MTRNTRIALFLMEELVEALRANDPDALKFLQAEYRMNGTPDYYKVAINID